MKILVLFDIDGTLITGKHGHAKAFSDAFDMVYSIDAKIDWKGVQGMTDQQVIMKTLLEKGLNETTIKAKIGKCMEAMNKSFKENMEESNIKPLEGVVNLLKRLKSKGAVLGLVTGNLAAIAQLKLEKAALWKFFDVGGFGSDNISRTELVKLAIKRAEDNPGFAYNNNVILFGDAPQDMKAGNEARVYTIGVTTGVYSKRELEKAGAKQVIKSLKDTNRIIKIILKKASL